MPLVNILQCCVSRLLTPYSVLLNNSSRTIGFVIRWVLSQGFIIPKVILGKRP